MLIHRCPAVESAKRRVEYEIASTRIHEARRGSSATYRLALPRRLPRRRRSTSPMAAAGTAGRPGGQGQARVIAEHRSRAFDRMASRG